MVSGVLQEVFLQRLAVHKALKDSRQETGVAQIVDSDWRWRTEPIHLFEMREAVMIREMSEEETLTRVRRKRFIRHTHLLGSDEKRPRAHQDLCPCRILRPSLA
jgi:hypothetical protein